MEIRRIEGIIPVEAISKDLPLKLENFSYHDMKRLLSQIGKGEFKEDKAQEFENLLLRAIFLEYTGDGKAKIKVGDTVLTAKLNVEKEFEPGQELILKVKSTYPEVELSLLEGKKVLLLSNTIENVLRVSGRLLYSILNPQLKGELLSYLKLNYPKLYKELSNFLSSSEFLPGKELLLTLLFILKPEVYKRVKKYLPPEVNREKVKELIEFTVGSLLMFSTLKVLVVPILKEEFDGRVFYGSYEGLKVALVEGETPSGKFLCLVRSLGISVSVEFSGLCNLLSEEGLKEALKEAGLNPVSVERVKEEKILRFKGKLLKGNLVEFTV